MGTKEWKKRKDVINGDLLGARPEVFHTNSIKRMSDIPSKPGASLTFHLLILPIPQKLLEAVRSLDSLISLVVRGVGHKALSDPVWQRLSGQSIYHHLHALHFSKSVRILLTAFIDNRLFMLGF